MRFTQATPGIFVDDPVGEIREHRGCVAVRPGWGIQRESVMQIWEPKPAPSRSAYCTG